MNRFKSFCPIKIWCGFLNILKTSFIIVPNLTSKDWWEWYTDVYLVLDNIMMEFIKTCSINTLFWDYILVSAKY